jgi:hypothetical protein
MTDPRANPTSPPVPADRNVLDAAKRRTIVAMLANGSSRRVAARFVGCAPSTITRTAARDPEFAGQLARAEEGVEVHALRAIRTAAENERHWRAAAWLLERRNPEDFASRPPRLYTPAQVVEMFSRVLATLCDEIDDEHRRRALERLDALLIESDAATGKG